VSKDNTREQSIADAMLAVASSQHPDLTLWICVAHPSTRECAIASTMTGPQFAHVLEEIAGRLVDGNLRGLRE
jgi:hypothetical protein